MVKYKYMRIGKIFILLLTILLPIKIVFALSATNEPVATASEVIVIYNSDYITDSNSDTVQDSLELANYYKNKRSVPNGNVIGVSAPLTEVITRAEYNTLKSTVETAITNAGLADTAKYIVLIHGMPLKIYPTDGNTSSLSSDYASVDSAMTLLYQTNHNNGYSDGNPYYNADSTLTLNYRFKPNSIAFEGAGNFGEVLKFLVTRLDGYTVSDVKGMIDRAYNANTTGAGYYVLDGHTNLGSNQNSDAHTVLKSLKKNVYPNPYTVGLTPITTAPGSVIAYTSHGKYSDLPADYYNNTLDFTYLNGAVTSTYESFNNFTYTEDNSGTSPYELHGQVAQFIRAGGSGGIGNAYEPFIQLIAQEDIWMPAYSIGYTWADSVYMSLPSIDWTTVVTGDPLMRIVSDGLSTPTVTTNNASSVTETTVTLNGTVNTTGGESNILQGFEYGTTSSYGTNTSSSGSFSTGTFSANITGLTCNTTYHYRAYSANTLRPGYGSDTTFTTSTCESPAVSTSSASSVASLSATLNGNVTDLGSGNSTIQGFQYGTTSSYGTNTSSSGSFSTGAFSASVTGLACNTTYHYRAYSTNPTGTGYGSDTTFTTTSTCPPTMTASSSSIDTTTATLSGQITDGGDEVVTIRGFNYGTTSSYGTSTTETGSYSSDAGFMLKFGSSGSSNGQFNQPRDVAVDSNGNIYVADRNNHRIQKFDSSGAYVTSWGSYGTGNTNFNYPRGIAVYETTPGTGFVYVADSDNHKIKKFDLNGTYITNWGGYGTGNGKTSYPQDVEVDSSGNVYASDYDNARVTKFTSTGTYLLKFGSLGSSNSQFNVPYDIAIDSNSNIYVADSNNHRIQKFDFSGAYVTQWGTYGSADGQLAYPKGIAIDSLDNVYVSDSGYNHIEKFDSNGNYLDKWGADGNDNNEFDGPQGLAVDPSNNIYVADYGNNRIQKFSNYNNDTFTTDLTGLTCGTTYHYRAYGTNSVSTGYSSDATFTTTNCIDVTAPTLSSISSSVTTTTSTITWTTDESASTSISYGSTSSYGTTTTETDTSPMVTSHNVAITGLTCGTTYHYQVISKDSSNNTSSDTDHTFTTSSCISNNSGGGGGGGGSSSSKIKTTIPVVSPVKVINIPITKVQNFVKSNSIKIGARGENVKTLQTFLQVQGPDMMPATAKIDGIFGKMTQQSVKNFQAKNKLVADGIVGKNTKLAIDSFNPQKYCLVPIEKKTC